MIDRAAVLDRFRGIRARTRALFDMLDESLYYERLIDLRNPVVFYEGHLPAFAVNTLIRRGLGRDGVDAHLERIFARGIDPDSEATAVARGNPAWPSRAVVREFAAAADRLIEDAIVSADLERDDRPLLRRAEALWAILEHEEMHQETLAYMWHQAPHERKRAPSGYVTATAGSGADVSRRVRIPAGVASLGTCEDAPFAWDNERPAHTVPVEAFTIDAFDVTNEQFLAFVEDGGYAEPRWWRDRDWAWVTGSGVTHPPFWERPGSEWRWRGMFASLPLPPSWPVYVTCAEAHAYARWCDRRLPTEAEYHRAAAGAAPGNCDFARWDPESVGVRPDSASRFGVHDLAGNGWEWTSTTFAPFEGFAPMPSYPEYSADFFDGDHLVLKGASPVTARGLVRPGFRNWFRPRYPYVYAAFRCVDAA